MRTAEEIREWLVDRFKQVVRRPAMYGGTASGVELYLQYLLEELSYIDQREADRDRLLDELIEKQLMTCRGVAGGFLYRVSETGTFTAEVASVYAAVAHRMGYFEVESALSEEAFQRLRRGLRTTVRTRDWRMSEVIERFGPASVTVGKMVLAYVGQGRPGEWICFDFATISGRYRDEDFTLREVRIPASMFVRELTFTPYGRRVREGAADPRYGDSENQDAE